MKLTLEHLGRIEHAELDIRPLTVFIGPNNTQKSWAAYSLFGLLNPFSERQFYEIRNPFSQDSPFHISPELTREIKQATVSLEQPLFDAARGRAPSDATAPILKTELVIPRSVLLKNLHNLVSLKLKSSGIAKILSVPESVVSRAQVVLEFSDDFIEKKGRLSKVVFGVSGPPIEIRASHIDSQGRGIQGLLTWWRGHEEFDIFLRSIIQRELWVLATAVIQRVVPFPAERKTLTSIYKLLTTTGTGSHEIMAEEDLSGLTSIPVQAFVAMLNWLDLYANEPDAMPNSVLERISHLLEEKVLGGKIAFVNDRPGSRPTFLPEGTELSLGVYASASVVRALAGLDLYLKHLATPDDFLIIDEPEMNAHPEAQIALTELLALLVNAGLQITLTTHSPYLVDHLANLMEAARLPESAQEEVQGRFKLRTREAFLHPDKVAVYHFGEDGQVSDILDRETQSLDWSTFSRQSDYLSQLYNDLLRAGVGVG